jgi:CRP-like cAMP-binding protein
MPDPLVAALGGPHAGAVRPHLEELALTEGQVLATVGEDQPWLVFLIDGAVEARGADGRVLATVTAPAVLGEVGFTDAGAATATVVAAGPGQALRVHRDDLPTLLAEAPDAAALVVRAANHALAERLSEATLALGTPEAARPRRVRVRRALSRMLGGR